MPISESKLIKKLHCLNIDELPAVDAKSNAAAVLVPLTLIGQQWHLLFIRRAEIAGDAHSGQVAFPGGTVEPGDGSLIDTALREAKEEVGLKSQHVSIIGGLPEFYSIRNIGVTPIVASIPWPYRFTLQTSEVSRVFTIPLEWLLQEEHYEIKQRSIPQRHVPAEVIYYKEYDGEVLWGLTARIVQGLLKK